MEPGEITSERCKDVFHHGYTLTGRKFKCIGTATEIVARAAEMVKIGGRIGER